MVFEIGRDGSVKSTSSTTDLKDKAVATCVQRAFGNLSFPQPEGGVVKVTYPIRFSPGDEAPSPAATPEVPSPPRTIHGKAVASATLADVERRLAELKLPVVEVPGFALGQSPALFVRDSSSKVFALSFGPGRDGLSGVRCVAAHRSVLSTSGATAATA